MTEPKHPIQPGDPEWWPLINRRAALSEQFPPLWKIRNERPGCAADRARQEAFRLESETRRTREAKARWDASVAENERRRLQADLDRYAARRRRQRDARADVA